MTSEEFKNLEIGDWVRESDEHYDKNVIFAPVPYRGRMRGRETDGKTGYQPRPVWELRSEVQTES